MRTNLSIELKIAKLESKTERERRHRLQKLEVAVGQPCLRMRVSSEPEVGNVSTEGGG